MKKRILGILLVSAAILTSCGMKSADSSGYSNSTEYKGGYSSYDSADYAAEEHYDSDVSNESDTVFAAEDDNSGSAAKISDTTIDREMLVYSCTMDIDVLEFEKSLDELKASMNQFGGFIENENFSDGGTTSRRYNKDSEKWHTYKATVRVPSRVYEDFCSSAAKLGDLRSKNASVENLSNEYRDLSTTLAIYEQKEERYISLLADIKGESQAVVIEDKLTEIQIQIARLRSRMDKIDKDVAYSYVYITLNEVKEYEPEPVKKDTFGQRFINTVKDATGSFLYFLEDLLYFLIYALPYLVLFFIGAFIFVKLVKCFVLKKKNKKEKKTVIKEETVTEENSVLSDKTDKK